MKNECMACKDRFVIAGQGFTTYICKFCSEESMHSNTDVPTLCNECSEKLNICCRCKNI